MPSVAIDALRLTLARALEEGRAAGLGGPAGPVARGLARVWGEASARALARPLPVRDGVAVVAVGGATLGGSGKTPLAIACARALARSGARVAFVGHGYRARARLARPRIVAPGDPLALVGDEALVAAEALAPDGVPVVLGPRREIAAAFAARLADVLVLDGVVQTRPRAALALLAVDAREPWGRAAQVPPCGDLRAPVEALERAVDWVVRVGAGAGAGAGAGPDLAFAEVQSRGAWVDGVLWEWERLARARVGLFVALARPERIVHLLADHGVFPEVVVRAPDHGSAARPQGLARASASVKPADFAFLWLATPKCAHHATVFFQSRLPGGAPAAGPPRGRLAILDHNVVLSPVLCAALARLDPREGGP